MSSDDPAAFEKKVISSDKRFEIYVPKPKSRINVGAPAAKKHPDGPFAHPGVTISADDHVFVQSGKEMVVQSGKDANFLVGGTLGQHAKTDLQLTAGGDMVLSAGQRVLVISGASNTPAARADHGDSLRLQAYNNLAQHYRVDALEVGLFEFFHGRRDRPKRMPGQLAKMLGQARKDATGKYKAIAKRKKFDHTDPAIHQELAKDPLLQGGFTRLTLRSLQELYPALDGLGDPGNLFFPKNLGHHPTTRSAAEKITHIRARKGLFPRPAKIIPAIPKIQDASDPRYWIEPLFTNDPIEPGMGKKGLARTVFGTDDILELEYGFSSYYSRFDPYKSWKPKAFNGWAAQAMVTLKNALLRARRMLDCLIYATGLPGAMADLIVQGASAVPVAGPMMGALGAAFEAYGTVADSYEQYQKTYSDPDTQNPEAEQLAAFAEAFTPQPDDRQASIKSADGPWDLSSATKPWTIKVVNDIGVVRDITLDFGPIPPRPAVLSFAAGDLHEHVENNVVTGSDTVDLALEIDGRSFTFSLDCASAPNAAAAAAILTPALASIATVSEADGTITITSLSSGPEARILVVSYADDSDESDHYSLTEGWIEHGVGAVPPVADPKKVTADEIAARLDPALGTVISAVGPALRLSSELRGKGSKIEVSGTLATKIFTSVVDNNPKLEPMSDEVTAKISPDWEQIDSMKSVTEPITTWIKWAKQLPDKAQAMFDPLTNALGDLLSVVQNLEAVAEGVLGVAAAGGPEIPGAPESVGIFGSQGLTLGTHDRIVGSGSHGILFVVDGGSGEPDKGKQVGALERAARIAGGFTPPLRATKKQSLGFRVFSDSLVDLTAANGVQLLAIGRAEAKANRAHGKKIGGIGVARVLSSWVTEVAGHEKVIISARSKGDSSDSDALTGGRVEVAAQTIAIGGVRIEDKDDDGNEYGPYDFDETRTGVDAHGKSFGITPLELASVALGEHLTLAKQKKDPLTGQPKPPEHLKGMSKYAWPKLLRKEHARTERVHVHSEKEIVILTGAYMIHVSKDGGVQVGTRKADKDPSKNELDENKPRFVVDNGAIRLVAPNKDKSEHTGLAVFEGQTVLTGTDASGDPARLSLAEGSATLSAGTQDSIEISKSDGMKLAVSKIDATASGTIKIKGGQVQIG